MSKEIHVIMRVRQYDLNYRAEIYAKMLTHNFLLLAYMLSQNKTRFPAEGFLPSGGKRSFRRLCLFLLRHLSWLGAC